MASTKRYLAALILAAAMAGLILSGMAAHAAKAVYTYDSLGRLATVSNTSGTSTFVYDKVGNIMYADGSPLPVASGSPLSLDFGTIYINNTTEAHKVTFYNHGISNVTITNTVITGADAAMRPLFKGIGSSILPGNLLDDLRNKTHPNSIMIY